MDPLDGSSNIETNNPLGSIFGIYGSALPCSGERIIASAFVTYGPMVTLTFSTGKGVNRFGLVRRGSNFVFELTGQDLKIPDKPEVYGFGGLRREWIPPVERFVARLEPNERGPTATIFVFMLFNAVFWLAFEQAGSSLNLFTDLRTNRMLGGFEVPTTWFQSVNAGLIFLLAPLFAGLWSWLGHRGRDPGQPVKIALGLGFLSLGYVFMVWAGRVAADPAVKASMAFVLATYFWHTVGELCLSPTGLSYVTKAAPERYVSFLMGVWFISTFLANLGGGLVASQVEAIERGEIALPWQLGGQADFFMLFVVSAGAAGVLIFLLAPRLGRLARGVA